VQHNQGVRGDLDFCRGKHEDGPHRSRDAFDDDRHGPRARLDGVDHQQTIHDGAAQRVKMNDGTPVPFGTPQRRGKIFTAIRITDGTVGVDVIVLNFDHRKIFQQIK